MFSCTLFDGGTKPFLLGSHSTLPHSTCPYFFSTMKSSTDPIHFQGIEEEEKKALAKLPSVHMIVPLEEGGDGEKNEESGESVETHKEEGNYEKRGRREGKGLGVIAEDCDTNLVAEDNVSTLGVIVEDSDSAVHLDYSSDSLRSEPADRCERGQYEIDQLSQKVSEKRIEILAAPVKGGGGGQIGPFDRSVPILRQRGLGLQRSVSDVVEAEFPSPFSDSRSHFWSNDVDQNDKDLTVSLLHTRYRGFLLRHPKRSRDYSPALSQVKNFPKNF